MAGPATVHLHHGRARSSPSPALVVRLPRRPSSALARRTRPANERLQGDRDPGAAPRARDPLAPTVAATTEVRRSGLTLCADQAREIGALVYGLRPARDPPSLAPTSGCSALD